MLFRNQFEHWRSCHCVIGYGKQSWNLAVCWRNEICTGQLVWRSIGWTNWQKWWNCWRCSVCFNCLDLNESLKHAFLRSFLIWLGLLFVFSLPIFPLDILNVHQTMVYLFLWQRFHCHRYRANHVYHVPIRKIHSIRLVQWAVLHQQIHHACAWVHRYRRHRRSPHITLFTVHIENEKNNMHRIFNCTFLYFVVFVHPKILLWIFFSVF